MVLKPSMLFIRSITCEATTGEVGEDEVVFTITDDDKEVFRTKKVFKNQGGKAEISVGVDVSIRGSLRFHMVEEDPVGRDGEIWDFKNKNRKWLRDMIDPATGEGQIGEKEQHGADYKNSEYYVNYSFLKDPIPTVRVHAIKCETESAGCDEEIVDAVADVTEVILEETGRYLKKSKSLRVKACGKALDIASRYVQAIAAVYKWLAGIIEGDDDVYMIRRLSDDKVDISQGFFPNEVSQGEGYPMDKGKICEFENYLNDADYYRFPIDHEDVKLELRERDQIKWDISLGAINISQTNIEDSTMFNQAVVECATLYDADKHDGEGAVYHICWSLGYDDWTLPATFDAQKEIMEESGWTNAHELEAEEPWRPFVLMGPAADSIQGSEWENSSLSDAFQTHGKQLIADCNAATTAEAFYLPYDMNVEDGSQFQVQVLQKGNSTKTVNIHYQFKSGDTIVRGNAVVEPQVLQRTPFVVKMEKRATGWSVVETH